MNTQKPLSWAERLAVKRRDISPLELLAIDAREYAASAGLNPEDYRVEDGELTLGYGRKIVADGHAAPVLIAHGRVVRVIDADETGDVLLIAAIEDGARENDEHADACEAAVLEEVPDEPEVDVDVEILRLAAVVERKLDTFRAARAELDEAEAEAFARDVENVRAALATVRAGRVLAPGRRFCADDHLRPLRVAFGDASNDLRGALATLAIATRS